MNYVDCNDFMCKEKYRVRGMRQCNECFDSYVAYLKNRLRDVK